MKVFYIGFQSNTPWPWLIAAILVAGALLLGRKWGPKLADAFSNAALPSARLGKVGGV